MIPIYKRELKSYFTTPTGYLFVGVFLALSSLIFYLNNLQTRSSDYAPFLSMMSYVWMLLSPILIIKLMAGERKQGTDQLLMTAPVSSQAIVLGKYLAACSVLLIAVLLTCAYPAIISIYTGLHVPEIIVGYLGFVLQGCAFIALDLMVSGFMKNAVSAAAITFGTNLFMWLISLLSTSLGGGGVLMRSVRFISLYDRFVPFLNAQLSIANLIYYLLFIVCMLQITISANSWRRVQS